MYFESPTSLILTIIGVVIIYRLFFRVTKGLRSTEEPTNNDSLSQIPSTIQEEWKKNGFVYQQHFESPNPVFCHMIARDIQNKVIFLMDENGNSVYIPADEILEANVESMSQRSRFTGKKQTDFGNGNKIEQLSLILHISNPRKSRYRINFLPTPLNEHSDEFQQAMENAKEWEGSLNLF